MDFIAAAFVGLRLGYAVVFANPDWADREWQVLGKQLDRVIVFGDAPVAIKKKTVPQDPAHHLSPGLYIATGGSSGRLRFAHHTLTGLQSHVRAFCEFFGWEKVNSLCVLPLYHVSGWMQVMRTSMTGGAFQIVDKGLVAEAIQRLDFSIPWGLSLVPTQLCRLLDEPSLKKPLSRLQAVFLGGSAIPVSLVKQAVTARIRVWLTYGMTETASMVAAVAGAELSVVSDSADGKTGPSELVLKSSPTAHLLPHTRAKLDEGGRLWLQCASQCNGYWPQGEWVVENGWMRTDDRAEISANGRLRILGRVDDLIISGGEKVDAREVEAVILSYPGVDDCYVYGVPDPEWGQRVCAMVSGSSESVDQEELQDFLKAQLAPYKVPKSVTWMSSLPRNEVGKVLSS